jgi:putative endonuclease
VKSYFVYIVECNDATYYTGITNNLEQRLLEHNQGKRAAKYTRSRRPVKLVYQEKLKNKSKALQREHEIKSMNRLCKSYLIASME